MEREERKRLGTGWKSCCFGVVFLLALVFIPVFSSWIPRCLQSRVLLIVNAERSFLMTATTLTLPSRINVRMVIWWVK